MRTLASLLVALCVLLASPSLTGGVPAAPRVSAPSRPADGASARVVAQLGGALGALALSGDLAYVAVGATVHVLDVSNPATPTLLGESGGLGAIIRDVAVNGSSLYVLAGTGLRVFDVSTPQSPQAGATISTDEAANALALDGDTLCVVDRHNLYVLDATTPSLPSLLGRIHIGSFAEAVGVAVLGNHAYVANEVEGLAIVDISIPAVPELAGRFDTADNVRDVAVLGKRAYLANAMGLQIVDVTDPDKPLRLGGRATPGIATAVAVTIRHAYVADGLGGLQIVDIANSSLPAIMGEFAIPGLSEWVSFADDHAFVSNGSALHVVDVATPEEPAGAGSYASSLEAASSVGLAGSIAYVTSGAGGLYTIDVMTATAPVVLGNVRGVEDAAFVAHQGAVAYVAASFEGLWVVDVSDPATPMGRGMWPVAGEAESVGVAVEGNLAYLANQPDWDSDELAGGGLRIIDCADPDNPAEIGFYEAHEQAWAVAASGGYAYLGVSYYDELEGEAVGGLSIIDISDPTAPDEVAFLPLPDEARALALRGSLILVGTPSSSHVVDVSNPTAPRLRGASGAPAYGIAADADYAYLASFDLTVLDLSDPDAPLEMGHVVTPGRAAGVAAGGGFAIVADGAGGIVIVEVPRPAPPSVVYLPLGMRNRQ